MYVSGLSHCIYLMFYLCLPPVYDSQVYHVNLMFISCVSLLSCVYHVCVFQSVEDRWGRDDPAGLRHKHVFRDCLCDGAEQRPAVRPVRPAVHRVPELRRISGE